MNALQLFRSGRDYIEIGLILGIHESEVEKQIHDLRRDEIFARGMRAQDAQFRDDGAEVRERAGA